MDRTSLQQARFEDLLASASLADPVQVWSEYAKWAAKHLPSQHLSVLARACKRLTDNAKYHDDVRLLRLWVYFADQQGKVATHTFFGSLEEQGIGINHALLYEAWAASLEAKRLFVQADVVYQKGIKRSAQPLTRLQRRVLEFRHRMAKRKSREVRKRQREAGDASSKRHCGRNVDDARERQVADVLAKKVDHAGAPLLPLAPMDQIRYERPHMTLDPQIAGEIPQKKPQLLHSNYFDNTLRENIPPGENGVEKKQPYAKYNVSCDEFTECATSCMQSTASITTREKKPLNQSRPVTQNRPLTHLRAFTQSRRVSFRKSFSIMRDIQSSKRRRESAPIAPQASVASRTDADTQPPLMKTVTAEPKNAIAVKCADGLSAVGEQMFVDRDREILQCDSQTQNAPTMQAPTMQLHPGPHTTHPIVDKVEMKEHAERMPRWLPFRRHGC